MAPVFLFLAIQLLASDFIRPPMIRAALQEKCVYTSGVARRGSDAKLTFGGGSLWVLKMGLKEGSQITSLDHKFGIGGNRNALLRWQLIDRHYSCIAHYGTESDESNSGIGIMRAIPLTAIELANANRGRSKLDPDHQAYRRTMDQGPFNYPIEIAMRSHDDSIKKQIFFDFWCRDDKRYEVYVTEPHKGNRLTRHDYHPEWTNRLDPFSGDWTPNPAPMWDKAGEWTFDWKGPFYVAPIGDDRYFVTDTGRVFASLRGGRSGMALKEIWKGPPVDALIHDSDAKTWYAFTKDQFFEIADPIKPKPHAIAIHRKWTANEALETAVKCGRVIRSLPAPPINARTWEDLASPESRVGNKAVWAMSNEPKQALGLLKERLQQVTAPSAKDVAALIVDLGADDFTKREVAQKRLREFGHTIEPALRQAVATATHPERKRRLNQLLAECQRVESRTPDEVRAARAVQVLSRVDTPEARRLLEAWGKGAEAAVLTREARKALQP